MKSRLLINLSTNFISLGIGIFLSFWMTPFIIGHLGADAYGFIPLVQNIINFLTVITIALNSTVSRFFTYAIHRKEYKDAEEYVNTSFYASLALNLFLILPIFLLIMFIDQIMDVPDVLLFEVRITIIFQGLIFMVSTMNTTFGSAAYSMNKLYINNIIQSSGTIFRAVIVLTTLQLLTPHIWFVSMGSFLSTLGTFIATVMVFKRLIPETKFKLSKFSWRKCKELVSLGIWSSINYIGSYLYLQLDMIVANRNLGPTIAGEYAAVLQLSSLMRLLANTMSAVFTPTYVALYAENRFDEIVLYSKRAVSMTGFLMAIPIGILGGSSASLLGAWLGSDFLIYRTPLIIIASSLALNVCVSPLFALNMTYKRVKIPSMVQIFTGIINVSLALLFTGSLKMGAFGLAVSGAISYTFINTCFVPIYASIITKQSFWTFYPSMIRSFMAAALVGTISFSTELFFKFDNWMGFFINSLIAVLCYVPFCYFILLKKDEKLEIMKIIFSIKSKLLKA